MNANLKRNKVLIIFKIIVYNNEVHAIETKKKIKKEITKP